MPWKKGQSGNPNGRPLKGFTITDAMRDAMKAKPELKEALVAKIWQMALQGDMAAMRLLISYLDGLPPQTIDLTQHTEYEALSDYELNKLIRDRQAELKGRIPLPIRRKGAKAKPKKISK